VSRPWLFDPLQMFGYDVIYADPPWAFENWSESGMHKNAAQHYPTMTPEEIQSLPVGELASSTCALFLWVVDPLLDQGMETLKRWGFRYRTVAFTWAKLTKRGKQWHKGLGYYTRGNPETCLLGVIGDMPVPPADRPDQLQVDRLREHSRKPDKIRKLIERMYPNRRRVELFARASHPGWEAWGNETQRFDGGPSIGPDPVLLKGRQDHEENRLL
jgi:N6-adenosine-specific RNA methylase IME4